MNRHQIAGDRLVSHGSGITFKVKTKLALVENKEFYKKKFVVGFAGNVIAGMDLIEYMLGADMAFPKNAKGAEFIVLTEDNKMFTFIHPHKWLPVNNPYYAIGTGSQYAMGAMQIGASPTEAILATGKLDKSTGGGVTSYDF